MATSSLSIISLPEAPTGGHMEEIRVNEKSTTVPTIVNVMNADSTSLIKICNMDSEEHKEEMKEKQNEQASQDGSDIQEGSISVASVKKTFCHESNEALETMQHLHLSAKQICKMLLWFFGVVVACVVMVVPWTIIPRTNSIFYQSYWLEICAPYATIWLLFAGSDVMNLATWTREAKIMSIHIYLKIYSTYMVWFFILYVVCYVVWSVHYGFNHPMPYLGVLTQMFTWLLLVAGLWFLLPSELIKKEDFRRKLRIYMIYSFWGILIVFQNEFLSYLFWIIPANTQFLLAFLVAACRECDLRVRSKFVTMMVGEEDEPSLVLNEMDVNALYAFFMAVRLGDAELSTIVAVVVIQLGYHLITSYQIVREHRKIAANEYEDRSKKNYICITQLILGELTEGFTHFIYGFTMVMAYYGPNNHILATVGSSFWGAKIEDIMNFLYPMMVLFVFDTVCIMVTSVGIWKLINISMLQEMFSVLEKYWLFITVKIAICMPPYFALNDVNFGVDTTGMFEWITYEGRQKLLNVSNDLTDAEKTILFVNSTLIRK